MNGKENQIKRLQHRLDDMDVMGLTNKDKATRLVNNCGIGDKDRYMVMPFSRTVEPIDY